MDATRRFIEIKEADKLASAGGDHLVHSFRYSDQLFKAIQAGRSHNPNHQWQPATLINVDNLLIHIGVDRQVIMLHLVLSVPLVKHMGSENCHFSTNLPEDLSSVPREQYG
ncbi:hypothetical protein B296_00015318 [Ensete ventricosum]|uniref:Uncharacterized protein n=1 Tax=Ensete ventricosum TaxID=4639 RepID=A0A427AN68_ENSVE|nr:hypothetical protein B296_00015318 [Ensete ventricosum]